VTLKVAVVGCGKIADAHVEEIAKLANAGVVAVCDRELLMAEQLAARYGIARHFDDVDAMLEACRPDVVHITTPPQSHAPLARRALDAGCHVYVEKPFTVDRDEAVALLAHARAAGRKVTVGHSFAFDPLMVALRRLREEDLLGEAVHVESTLGYNLSGPFGAVLLGDATHWIHALPGKLFQNNVDHVLHKIEEFIPEDRPWLRALGLRRRPSTFGDARDALLDEMRVVMRGERATAYATFSAHAVPVKHVLRVYGTRNTVTADFTARALVLDHADRLPSAIGRLLPAFAISREYAREGFRNVWRFARADFQFLAGMNELFRRFYASILEDGDAPIAEATILRIAGWMDEIFAQLERGGHGGAA
jgi:predicted dehydrogenase